MIPGSAFAAWLADKDAQAASHAAIQAFVQRWKNQPLMADLERRLKELPERNAAAVLDIARSFMGRTAEIEELLAGMVEASRDNIYFRPPYFITNSDIHTGLLLHHSADLTLSLGVIGVDRLAAKKSGPRGPTSIGFTGIRTLFRYVKAGGATISFWEAPPTTADFVASRAGKAHFVGKRRIEDGEEILIDGRYQGFVIEHASSDMVYLQAMVRSDAAPLAVEYDSQTLSVIGASGTDEASSRVEMMVSLLRSMDREDAFPLMRESLKSPHFYVRWHVMREMLAMDADAVLPDLRAMATGDPHPDVRAAAERTLELFFEDERDDEDRGALQCHG